MTNKKAYVIGTNVSASLSPTIYQYWFEQFNIDGEYGYIEIKEDNFDKEIKSILKKDGLVGLNITMPFKEKIIPHLTQRSNLVSATSLLPINCISINGDKIIGENTDYIGFQKAYYTKKNSIHPKHKHHAIVLGFGGAAKAIIHSLIVMKYEHIMVFNRTFDKIKNLKYDFHDNKMNKSFGPNIEPHKIEDLPKHTNRAELIVNTTPTNLLSNSKKWDINPDCVGFDIVYSPREGTGFLEHFESHNRIEGILMLVYQAAPCFKLWFGVEPEIDESLFNFLYKKMDENK